MAASSPGLRLDVRASQQLMMTPALQQAISLLQLNNLELSALVAQEAEQNPLLEIIDATHDETTAPPAPVEPDIRTARDTADFFDDKGPVQPGAQEAALDVEGDSNIGGDSGYDSNNDWHEAGRGGNFDTDDYDPLAQTADKRTLRQHLLDQINIDFEGMARGVAVLLLDQLDESGYCRANLGFLAEQLNIKENLLEDVLVRLQQLDPPGVFARDLQDCLKLQLAERDLLTPVMQTLLDNLDVLAAHDYPRLAKKCGVSADDLTTLIKDVRSCDPKPTAGFDHAPPATLIPDILMRRARDATSGLLVWELELNSETLPRVLVNEKYMARVGATARNKEDKAYLADRFQAANWLVKALNQRAETILKISSEIVRQQDGFFREGISALKPMVLKDIAAAVSMHESTVSRVTTNKYMASPRGTFELKYFFNAAIANAHGADSHASSAVRDRIKQLIAAETPGEIMSDDRLVLVLQSEGIEIARRTVAKYREALNIPSSFQRKRQSKHK